MANVLRCILFLYLLPSVVPLLCYTCVFPSISPLDCLKFPTKCSLGQVCLSSKAVARRGDLEIHFYEKSCALPALCGLTGEKFIQGLNFTFRSDCCDTLLCNHSTANSAFIWPSILLSLLFTLFYSQ
uniref:sperm acrosome membrane-associated protein 4-like precursor n=1 Tax=Danio rerio TaxID=7955 RepID=UPI0000F1FCF1